MRSGLGYKLKPDVFDGDVPLREFLPQFEFIANANDWSDSVKTVALAACLRGRTRSLLDGIAEIGSVTSSIWAAMGLSKQTPSTRPLAPEAWPSRGKWNAVIGGGVN